MLKSGIYKLTNLVNNKMYVGSAVNISKRFNEHRNNLRNNKYSNIKLQNAWNKYGEGAFEFEIIEIVVDLCMLIDIEQKWIDRFDVSKRGYNLRPSAGNMLGFKHSEETKHKIKDGVKYVHHPKLTEEQKYRLSEICMGRNKGVYPVWLKENQYHVKLDKYRQMVSDQFRGKPKSLEHKVKLQKALKIARSKRKGHPMSGKCHTDKAKHKMRQVWKVRLQCKQNNEGIQDVYITDI